MADAETENSDDRQKTQRCWRILDTLEGAIEQFQYSPRLTISDNLKIGFFSSDHATQTDCSEILPLKDLTHSTEKLMKMTTSLQVDFGFLKELVQLKFEDRLKEESWKIVSKLQDRLSEMKRHYRLAADYTRKSYQQQLSDAIAVVKGMYRKFFEIEAEKAALQDAANLQMDVLARKLKEKEEILRGLRKDLEQCEEEIMEDTLVQPIEEKIVTEKELLDCKAENERLQQVIAALEEEAQMTMKENEILEDEIMCLKEISDQDQRTIQKLVDSRDRLKYELDCERLAIQDLINRQKDEIEIRRKYASITAKVTFLLPNMVPEELLLKLKKRTDEEKKDLETQIEALKVRLDNEQKKMDRFKKSSDQVNRNWERKFYILRNSLHVLKDEMFTRHTLFRQFAMIADTSFNYIKVKPLYVHSSLNMSESASPTNEYNSPTVDHKIVEIPSDQMSFSHLPKDQSEESFFM